MSAEESRDRTEMNRTIWSFLEEAMERHGGATAVVEGARRLTYEQFGRRVGGLAADLADRGVESGERVAILDRNSTAFLEAYFAAAGLGAILQPVNLRLRPADIAASLCDAGTRVFLAGSEFREAVAELRGLATPVEHWLDADAAEARGGEGFRPRTVSPRDPAHLYYTSGTTGRPKGVVLTHDNVCVHARTAVEELGLSAGDRWAHIAPLFHLADAWATFAITAVGGMHVVAPRFRADEVLGLMQREGVTITNLIPTMLKLMVESPEATDFDPRDLRMILSGGAPIAPALVRRIIEVFGCEYVQTYGMTETSPYLTLSLLHEHLRELPEEDQLRYRARTGRPFRAVELEVVDAEDRRVPADDASVGEIRVRGATVTPGYWNRPEETAEAIRDGWLYTGDLAVVDDEGYVDIVDRKKDMIISGGENVYSTEVEYALYEHSGVLEAAVFGLPDDTWGEIVVAAVVLRSGVEAASEELIAFCRERLAPFKIPRRIEFHAALPKTGSGKIAKAQIRDAARGAS